MPTDGGVDSVDLLQGGGGLGLSAGGLHHRHLLLLSCLGLLNRQKKKNVGGLKETISRDIVFYSKVFEINLYVISLRWLNV